MTRQWTFTSESVTEGHPDKMADQISDSILDAILAEDPMARVACETMVTTGLAIVAGEITTTAYVEIPQIVRNTINGIGYDRESVGYDGNTCGVITSIDPQSPDIAQGVDTALETRTGVSGEDLLNSQGAGDQGMMFGYAVDETPDLMPLPIWLAHRLAERLAEVRKSGVLPYLRPDGKTQVTVDYEGNKPKRLTTVLISTQHQPGIDAETLIKPDLIEHVITPLLPSDIDTSDVRVLVNPTGNFELGGPYADCGLTGRKIIVDTYGGAARHGGGAFSGKDPSKVDRSAAYAARWVAKNVVAAGAASRCEVQVAYAIGVAQPVSVLVETFGSENVDPRQDQRRRARGVRPPPGRHHPRPRPAPADLPEDRRLRALRSRGQGPHLGAHHPGRRPEVRLGSLYRRWTRWSSGCSRTCRPSTRPSTTWSRTRSGTRCASGTWCASSCTAVGSAAGSSTVGVEPPDGVALRPLAKRSGLGPTADLIELAEWAAWRWAGRPASLLEDRVAGAGRARAARRAGSRATVAPPEHALLAARLRGPAVGAAAAAGHQPRARRAGRCRPRQRAGAVPHGRDGRHDRRPAAAGRACRWRRTRPTGRRGAAGATVVGTRAAAWAPVGDLACVVVLDEHDEAHQQEQAPTWHARDVAIERARRAGVPCVLTSPCPTLEALRWGELHAADRARDRAGWPVVEVVDQREEDPRHGLLSEALARRLRDGRPRRSAS